MKTSDKIEDQLLTSKNILILLPEFCPDEFYLSAVLLAKSLKNLSNIKSLIKKVDIYKPEIIYKSLECYLTKYSYKNTISRIDPKSYSISVPYFEGSIERVKYGQEGDSLKIHLIGVENNISKDVLEIEEYGSRYDLIILMGFSDIKNAGQVYEENTKSMDRINRISITLSEQKESDVVNVYKAGSIYLVEVIWNLLEDLGEITPDEEIAGLALLCTHTGINNLSFGSIFGPNIDIIKKINRKYKDIYSKLKPYQFEDHIQNLKIQQRIYMNIKFKGNDYIWSILNGEDLQALCLNWRDVNLNNPIVFNSRSRGSNAFLIVEKEDGSSICRIESDNGLVDKVTKEFGGVFSAKVCIFSSEYSPSELEQEIIEMISTLGQERTKQEESFKEYIEKINEKRDVRGKFEEKVIEISSNGINRKIEKECEHEGYVKPSPLVMDENDLVGEFDVNPIVPSEEDDKFGPPKILRSRNPYLPPLGTGSFGSFE